MSSGAVDNGMERNRESPPLLPLTRWIGRVHPAFAPSRGGDSLDLLAPLLQYLPPAPPPPGLLPRIEEQIRAVRCARQYRRTVVHLAAAAAVGAIASAAAMLALAPSPRVTGAEAPVPLTVLDGPEMDAMLDARTLGGGRYLRLDHFGLRAAEGRALELWLLRQGSGGPDSLGLLATRNGLTVLPVSRPIAEGDLLAVSEEAPGGATGSGPAGPVILTVRVGGEN